MSAKTKAKAKAKTQAIATQAIKTETVSLASVKVANAIAVQAQTAALLVSKKRLTCEAVRAEALRLGIADDSKKTRQMVVESWVLAYERKHKFDDDNARAAFIQRSQPEVSKIMAMAYPANDRSEAELSKVFKHNDNLPADAADHSRIGEGAMLHVARGKMTFDEVIEKQKAGRANVGKKKGKKPLDNVVSPEKRVYNMAVQLLKELNVFGKEPRLSEQDFKKAINQAIVDVQKPSAK